MKYGIFAYIFCIFQTTLISVGCLHSKKFMNLDLSSETEVLVIDEKKSFSVNLSPKRCLARGSRNMSCDSRRVTAWLRSLERLRFTAERQARTFDVSEIDPIKIRISDSAHIYQLEVYHKQGQCFVRKRYGLEMTAGYLDPDSCSSLRPALNHFVIDMILKLDSIDRGIYVEESGVKNPLSKDQMKVLVRDLRGLRFVEQLFEGELNPDTMSRYNIGVNRNENIRGTLILEGVSVQPITLAFGRPDPVGSKVHIAYKELGMIRKYQIESWTSFRSNVLGE